MDEVAAIDIVCSANCWRRVSPIPQATLRQAFATKFTLLLGQDDVRTTEIIRDNKQTRAQGNAAIA
jgi:hypothetical protein